MSTQSESPQPTDYEEGFLSQNTWLRPVALFVALCLGIITLIIGSNWAMGWLGGRFGQVLFGMIASLIFMCLVVSTILLVVNGIRYVIDQ